MEKYIIQTTDNGITERDEFDTLEEANEYTAFMEELLGKKNVALYIKYLNPAHN